MIFHVQVTVTLDAENEDEARDKIHSALSGMDNEIIDIEEEIEDKIDDEEEEPEEA